MHKVSLIVHKHITIEIIGEYFLTLTNSPYVRAMTVPPRLSLVIDHPRSHYGYG